MKGRVLSLLFCSTLTAVAASRGCVGSVSVASFRLSVQPAGSGSSWVPVRQVNNIPSGYRISYQPLDLPADLRNNAKLTFVMVPKASDGQVTVLEPRPAASSTEWTAPFTSSIAVLVFAPQGLDEKRLTNLVTKDPNLVAALADYADQTAQLEAALDVANEIEQQDDEDADRPPRPTTPAEQAIFALVRALNPSVSSYNPLGAGRRAGAATLMGKGTEAFFENAGGLVPGGGILPVVKAWLLPDTEFRSVYGIPSSSDGMALCAQLGPRSRNRMAYLWAYRLTNASPPATAILKDVNVPLGMRVGVPVKLASTADWRLLDRVFDWALIADGGSVPPMHVPLRPIVDERSLQLDLRKFAGPPGAYRIEGRWDWDAFKVSGTVNLHRLDDLKAARVAAASQDKLVTGAGPIPVELTGADLQFVDRVTLHRPASARQIPVDMPVDRAGAADKLTIEVDTDGLRPGPYLLAISRIDGATAELPLQVLPPNPRLEQAPPRINMGEREQTVTLAGAGLDRIEKIACDRADIVLAAATEDAAKRGITVRLHPDAKPGERLTLLATVRGLAEALRFPGALQVAGARPKIQEAKPALARDLPITPRDGELPAGSWVSYAIRTDPLDSPPLLSVQCAEPVRTIHPEKLHVGEKNPNAQLAASEDGTLFLSLDPGSVGQSGCSLTATIETESLGKSDPVPLGRVVRLPRIEAFSLTEEKSADGYYGLIRGFDLETIERTGWDSKAGLNAPELPRPVAGEGAKQTLRIVMPWPSPSPKAPLFVWLRGETEGRATKVTQ
jgi:hypothetical protein